MATDEPGTTPSADGALNSDAHLPGARPVCGHGAECSAPHHQQGTWGWPPNTHRHHGQDNCGDNSQQKNDSLHRAHLQNDVGNDTIVLPAHRPGQCCLLINGMINVMISNGRYAILLVPGRAERRSHFAGAHDSVEA